MIRRIRFASFALAALLVLPLQLLAADWDEMAGGRHSLEDVGSDFFVKVPVKHVPGARLVLFNERAARDLGLNLPSDPKELEKVILERFAYMVTDAASGEKQWLATYYQDSNGKGDGEARGDRRALWSGETSVKDVFGKVTAWIDVVLKGIGQTPLAWLNHSDPGHKDGFQSMREAVHSFIMSEVNYRNELNTTIDLAVIELPIEKVDKHSGLKEKAAITIRVGEQTRVAHLRYWADEPTKFGKIMRYVMGRVFKKRATVNDTPEYLKVLASKLADEAARYYDLHAVHSSPTAGNRTTSGATIDLGTFRYLDAHHSDYSYLFDQLKLGGSYGQVEQMGNYIEMVGQYIKAAKFADVSTADARRLYKKVFEEKLTDLWLSRLGLDRESSEQVSRKTRKALYEFFRKIYEAEQSSFTFKLGDRLFHPAKYEPRLIFAGAMSALTAAPEKQREVAMHLFESERPWYRKVASGPEKELLAILSSIRSDVQDFDEKLPNFITKSRNVNSKIRPEVGPNFVKEHETPVIEAIQSGKVSYRQITESALAAATHLVDPQMLPNPDVNTGRKERVGVYSGTFDPPHLGHWELIKRALDEYSLDKIYIVVNSHTDHKTPVAPFEFRRKMAEVAFAKDPRVVVADRELQKNFEKDDMTGVLESIAKRHPTGGLYHFMGDDSFERYLKLNIKSSLRNTIVVNPRSADSHPELLPGQRPFMMSVMPYSELTQRSSTRVREDLGLRAESRDLDPAVNEMIRASRYYPRPDPRVLKCQQLFAPASGF